MKILFINPNSSQIVTDSIDREVNKFRINELEIDVIKSKSGPIEIKTSYDEITAASFVVSKVKEIGQEYNAVIVGCFSDPGLTAVRDIVDIPVVGIGETSIYTACLYGSRFSIIASGGHEDISVFKEIARKYGLESRLASVHYLSFSIEDIDITKKSLIRECIDKCIYEDGANVVILGCAAFVGFGSIFTKEVGIPVLDGIQESISFTKMMVENNYKQK